MEYRIYFNKLAFPVTTDKISIKHPSRNKSLDLVSEGEVNALRSRGLREVTLDLVLPAEKRPYAYYASGFKAPQWYLGKIQALAGKKFRLIIIRSLKTGKGARDDAFDVTLEDYEVVDDVDEGRDVTVRLELKEYKDYGVKKVVVKTGSAAAKSAAAQDLNNKNMSIQQTQTARAKERDSQYTTKAGDKLTGIAKKYYGSKDSTAGAKLLFKLNKSTLKKKSPDTTTYSKAIVKGVTLKVPKSMADLKKAVK